MGWDGKNMGMVAIGMYNINTMSVCCVYYA